MKGLLTSLNVKRLKYSAQLSQKLISQERYDKKMGELQKQEDKKEKEIRLKQAKREKALAVFNAIITLQLVLPRQFRILP